MVRVLRSSLDSHVHGWIPAVCLSDRFGKRLCEHGLSFAALDKYARPALKHVD